MKFIVRAFRLMKEAWECDIGETVDPYYFHPPMRVDPILCVTAFHKDYPQGRVFERKGLEMEWKRIS